MSINFKRSDFPEGFDFGVATSAYQIEGSDFGGCGRSQWDDFAATPGNVVRGENGGVACDHYHQWEGDLDLIKAGGFDSYRFSTSWARVMPEGRGTVNEQGLDYYERIVDGLLERGIKPNVSLYHWELPSALLDQGGWRNGDIANWMIPGKMIKGMGGAMDLVASAENIIVAMTHTNRKGKSKLLKSCTLPLTGVGCVKKIVTNMAVLEVVEGGFKLIERAPGVSVEAIQAATEGHLIIEGDIPEMVI